MRELNITGTVSTGDIENVSLYAHTDKVVTIDKFVDHLEMMYAWAKALQHRKDQLKK